MFRAIPSTASRSRRHRAAGLALVAWAACAQAAAAQPIAAAPGSAPTLPPVAAAGRQSVAVAIPSFGRWTIAAHSRLGARLELIDRMAGTLGAAGEAGGADGRLDLLLDRREYLLVIESPETRSSAAAGTVALELLPASERNQTPEPALAELSPLSTELGDHEQRSYWLEIDAARTVFLEAAGRHLDDLRLWRDGDWLEEAAPDCAVRHPVAGQPLMNCFLAVRLEPGRYRLTAYGGAGQAWAQESAERPLHLRWGLTPLPAAGRARLVMGPFGRERFRVAAATNYFRLELPQAGEATLRTGAISQDAPFLSGEQSSASLTKETRPFAAEMLAPPAAVVADESEEYEEDAEESYEDYEEVYEEDSDEGGDRALSAMRSRGRFAARTAEGRDEPASDDEALPAERWLEVVAAPGQAILLQQFEWREVSRFERSGRTWLSTVHSGHPGDDLDATAVLSATITSGGRNREVVVTAAAVPVGPQQPWLRRFNLLEDATVFLEIGAAGRYQVIARGTAARFRIEPFLTEVPENYRTPPWRPSGETWELARGLHVLSIEAERQGILELGVRPAGQFPDLLDGAGAAAAAVGRGEARLGEIELQPGTVYTLHRNRQPGVSSGVVLRELPLDLSEALPLALVPNERVQVSFATHAPGFLRAPADSGVDLPLMVDGGAPATEVSVEPGLHTVVLTNPGVATLAVSLQWHPAAALLSTAVPTTTATPETPERELEPAFTELRPGDRIPFDLERRGTRTFLLRAERPALHSLASTGLLATGGNLRTRTVTSLRRAEQNGVGRNFSIQEFLAPGEYQLTVAARGESAGHLGVTLAETPLGSGGVLRPGEPARATLRAGEGLAYTLEIAEAGSYRLRAAGAGFLFGARLEDAGGWPLEAPGAEADLERRFAAGSYRLVLLPRDVDVRSLVTLERLEQTPRGEGHGPVALRLGIPHRHLWREPETGADREPDRYRFNLPAAARVRLDLDGEMQARLLGPAGVEIAIPPGRAWSGELAAGDYQLAVVCSRPNNLVTYTLAVATEELVAGSTHDLRVPGELAISVGGDSLIEIASLAPVAVRATLFDFERRPVARSRSRPDDWNFLLTERLAPGRYWLAVEPLAQQDQDGEDVEIAIAMRAPTEIEAAAVKLALKQPWTSELQPGDAVRTLPLLPPAGAELLAVDASADENIGCALETAEAGRWRSIAEAAGRAPALVVALDPERPAPLRLRLWSLDRRGLPLRLAVAASRLPHVGEARLRAGIGLAKLAGATVRRGALVELDRPGSFQPAPGEGLRWATAPLTELLAGAADGVPGSVLATPATRLWVASANGEPATARAERVNLPAQSAAPLQLRLPASGRGAVDLEASRGSDGPSPSGGASARTAVLLVATSLEMQPGVAARPSGSDREADAMAVAAPPGTPGGAAAGVALNGRAAQAVVWNASGAAAGEVALEQRRFDPATLSSAITASPAALDGWCEAGGALVFPLQAGAKRIRVALGDELVAALAADQRVLSVHWQGGPAFEETLESSATELWILNPASGRAPYRVDVESAPAVANTLAPDSPTLERHFQGAGLERLALRLPEAGAPPWELHLRGEGAVMTLIQDDGRVLRGTLLRPADSGTLILEHGPGELLAWLDHGAAASGPAWPRPAAELPIPSLDLGAAGGATTWPLRGGDLRLRLGEFTAWRIAIPAAAVAVLRRPHEPRPEVALHAAGARLDLLGAAGGAELLLHAFGGGEFSGALGVTPLEIAPLGEGLGEPVLLPAGARRYFSFDLPEPRRIGIGVRAASGAVEAELYDRHGTRLERGVVAVAELAAGRYFLALVNEAPGTSAGTSTAGGPAAARPVIVGLARPATGPPDEVIREYLREPAAPETSVTDSDPIADPGTDSQP